MKPSRVLVVGAGFSGAVFARAIAEAGGPRALVIDSRPHTGGNCHTSRDERTGVMLHTYGPHIFHTCRERVWQYVQRFSVFRPYVHRVKAMTSRGVFSLPINLHTINQLFDARFSPAKAEAFVRSQADASIGEPRNFEEQALKFVGREIYELFLRGYTAKQWGCDPVELPAEVLRRLPLRFDYNDGYHHSRHQGMPEDGYGALIDRILDHPSIDVEVSTPYEPAMRDGFTHVIFTGCLDEFYGGIHGRLGYRTVFWERTDGEGDLQGAVQINYPELTVPHTRTIEPKHFEYWTQFSRSMVFTEFAKETGADDVPFYPKRLRADLERFERYRALAEADRGVSFIGRLATYRYLDMERVIDEALDFADDFLQALDQGHAPPVFPRPV